MSSHEALRAWLADWPRERLPLLLYVVDGGGHELLGREVPAAVVADARQRARSADPRRPARQVTTADVDSEALAQTEENIRFFGVESRVTKFIDSVKLKNV